MSAYLRSLWRQLWRDDASTNVGSWVLLAILLIIEGIAAYQFTR